MYSSVWGQGYTGNSLSVCIAVLNVATTAFEPVASAKKQMQLGCLMSVLPLTVGQMVFLVFSSASGKDHILVVTLSELMNSSVV